MNAVDTNVLVYTIDRHDPVKRAKARDLMRRLRAQPPTTVLLWQVAGEFTRYLRRCEDQGQIARTDTLRYLALYRRHFPLIMPTPQVLDKALDLSARYSLSHWDSMLLAACQESHVDALYTEDMGSPTAYGGIQLMNPFA
jgi:predicted nucleic acid-binding protein